MTSASFASITALTLGAVICAGCGLQQTPPASSAAGKTAPVVAQAPAMPGESAPVRHVGDFFVHRFSGSFATDPLTLTEEVVGQDGQVWLVDFALAEGDQVERMRVRFDVASGAAVSATHLGASGETPAKLADYEALMGRTVYAADVNDGLVSTNQQTCLVGADELDCETKTYKVWVGEDAATLAVVHAQSFADRDVSGEITTEDGKLIYRAELVEARQGKPAQGVASR